MGMTGEYSSGLEEALSLKAQVAALRKVRGSLSKGKDADISSEIGLHVPRNFWLLEVNPKGFDVRTLLSNLRTRKTSARRTQNVSLHTRLPIQVFSDHSNLNRTRMY
ncbi:hypothetical protein Tco_0499159 [Tanacetum coccineum]